MVGLGERLRFVVECKSGDEDVVLNTIAPLQKNESNERSSVRSSRKTTVVLFVVRSSRKTTVVSIPGINSLTKKCSCLIYRSIKDPTETRN
jgi:uncharacterized RmlC-like cupin family protein